MAKDNNLQDFLTDIADAIREKKGTTEKINPQDFATEIANLSSVEETSNIEYLDVSGMSYEKMYLIFNSYLVRFIYDNKVQVVGGASLITMGDVESALTGVVAVAIDFNSLIIKGGNEIDTVLEDLIHSFTQEQLDSIPRLTKEQFYSLEA